MNALEMTPPELSSDIFETGIYLQEVAPCSGSWQTTPPADQLKVHVDEDPLRAVPGEQVSRWKILTSLRSSSGKSSFYWVINLRSKGNRVIIKFYYLKHYICLNYSMS